ncbi:MAG: hypothetical protein FJY85_07250 [Deltaproteobacteria bacterium]|nr:hypothetical protein [Deltaproteobacteria bacterium]
MTDSSFGQPHEEKQIRCPKLGGPVHFDYCQVEQQGRPCSRALVCWAAHFDAEAHFRSVLTPEEFNECFLKTPPSKVVTLLELIAQTRKIAQEKRTRNEDIP